MRIIPVALGITLFSLAAPRGLSAQLEIGTWKKKDAGNQTVMTMKIEACCGAKGRRLSYDFGANSPMSLSLDTKMDGSEAPVMMAGKPSGETMALKRVDARHATNVIKFNGTQFATSVATLSADGKTLTVVTDVKTAMAGMTVGKQTEVWVKQ